LNNYCKFPERDKPNNNRISPQKWGLWNRFEPLFDQITLRNELDNRSRSPVRRSDDHTRYLVTRSDNRIRSPMRKADIRSEYPIRKKSNNHNLSPQRKYVNERCKLPQREETEHRNTSLQRKR
jgi:hypothetical protein